MFAGPLFCVASIFDPRFPTMDRKELPVHAAALREAIVSRARNGHRIADVHQVRMAELWVTSRSTWAGQLPCGKSTTFVGTQDSRSG